MKIDASQPPHEQAGGVLGSKMLVWDGSGSPSKDVNLLPQCLAGNRRWASAFAVARGFV